VSGVGASEGSSGQSAPAPDSSPVLRPHPAVFWVGLLLMIVSFALYPAFALIAVLPISRPAKVAADFSAWLISWGSFSIGSAMAGAEGIEYLRRLWRRSRSP
jgi:hypothetical protein